ncbi:hypothetical protein SARC_07668 [Sphaeroforma arctica JP610]|uniref:Glycosyltransferase 2-like domain-containing protein n=1 Tax=Sphaeroforma arctica JP610 TaxID=667725 RepID=A0A0L0FT08_9EUKA|nr:hypothetical protein SARC_07668 [Sphaeroforma arctica JP610]KNC79952.1 hypothetical protein SARC_07668 [Sphaeroforma arctica JP610]|eukprot:XP_014153854.1 hypothetical protein SARC_07668 [Sphaeroforma arctica JP610]
MRHSMLAMYRNTFISAELGCDIDYVLWIDDDMVDVGPDVLPTLLAFNKPIVVPRCLFRTDTGKIREYDLNSWKGRRTKPPLRQLQSGSYPGYVPRPDKKARHKHLNELMHATVDRLVEIESVGATVLLVNAEVHCNGINFPVMNVIGATWNGRGGYDGIETEGLCYMAKIIGYQCYAAPHITVRHRD